MILWIISSKIYLYYNELGRIRRHNFVLYDGALKKGIKSGTSFRYETSYIFITPHENAKHKKQKHAHTYTPLCADINTLEELLWNLLAAAVVPLGKALYHCLVPRKGLKAVGPLVACL